MKNLMVSVIFILFMCLSGCSHRVKPYSVNVVSFGLLQNYRETKISIGDFTSAKSGQSELFCRLSFENIKAPDIDPFPEYIRQALISELKTAKMYSVVSDIVLSGNIDDISFSSMEGEWKFKITLVSSNFRSLTIETQYSFPHSWEGGESCKDAVKEFMPAVQALIESIVSHNDFALLIGASN